MKKPVPPWELVFRSDSFGRGTVWRLSPLPRCGKLQIVPTYDGGSCVLDVASVCYRQFARQLYRPLTMAVSREMSNPTLAVYATSPRKRGPSVSLRITCMIPQGRENVKIIAIFLLSAMLSVKQKFSQLFSTPIPLNGMKRPENTRFSGMSGEGGI